MIYKILNRLESLLAKLQGKGYGASSISKEVDAVSKFIKSPKLIIDIGANKGKYTSEILSKFSGEGGRNSLI